MEWGRKHAVNPNTIAKAILASARFASYRDDSSAKNEDCGAQL